MNLVQFLRREGIQVVLVNPLHVKMTKRKDARVIALFTVTAVPCRNTTVSEECGVSGVAQIAV